MAVAELQRSRLTRRLGLIAGRPFWRRSYGEALVAILQKAERRDGGAAFFTNVHMLVERLSHRALEAAMRSATWVFPDGKPVAVAMRLFGLRRAERVAGLDALRDLCALAESRGLPVCFYGGSPETLRQLTESLER